MAILLIAKVKDHVETLLNKTDNFPGIIPSAKIFHGYLYMRSSILRKCDPLAFPASAALIV